MKRWVIKLAAMCLLLTLPFGAYFAYWQAKPAAFSGSIMGTVRHKQQLLRHTPGPRLILAGGSSSPYATDCAYLAEQLGLSTINVGATLYLGLDFYLNMLEKYMQQGDIIVLAPEHAMLEGTELSHQIVWMAIENHTEVWGLVPLSYWPGMVRGYHEYAESKRDLLAQNPNPDTGAYNADFGPLGDITLERASLLESGWNTEDPIALSAGTLSDEVAAKLNRFAKKAAKRGVQVLFAFAPVDELALTTTAEDWRALEERLRAELDFPVLGSLENAILPGEYFYDSNNHLTSEGQQIYSAQLAQDLRGHLQAKE